MTEGAHFDRWICALSQVSTSKNEQLLASISLRSGIPIRPISALAACHCCGNQSFGSAAIRCLPQDFRQRPWEMLVRWCKMLLVVVSSSNSQSLSGRVGGQ